MTYKQRLKDLQEGKKAKERGLDRLEDSQGDFLTTIRAVARRIARQSGKVTSDDLRIWAREHNLAPQHQNAWGAVFRGSEWEQVGWTKSTVTSNHARSIRVWKLR